MATQSQINETRTGVARLFVLQLFRKQRPKGFRSRVTVEQVAVEEQTHGGIFQ